MEEKKTNFFAIPVLSFVPAKYKELIKNSAGKLFGVLFVVFLILGLINGFYASYVLKDAAREIQAECPDFSVINGEFSCEKAFNMEEDGVYMVIDDSLTDISEDDIKSKITEGYYQSVLIIGQEEIGTYSNGRIQIMKYSDVGLTNFTKDMLFEQMIPSVMPIIVAAIVVWRLLCLAGYYFATLIMGLLTLLMSSIMSKDLSFKQCFRITLLAKLPIYIVLFIIEKFITISLGIHLLIGAVLILIYTGIILNMFDNNEPQQYIDYNNQ